MNRKQQKTALNFREINSICRRNFLTNTALVGAGLVLSPLWPGCSEQPKNKNNQSGDGLNKNESK